MQASSYNGYRFVSDRGCERRPAKSALFHPGLVHMYDQLSGRLVMFFVARCHEDLSWFLSVEPETLNRAANGCYPRAMASRMVYTNASIDDSSKCRVIEMRRREVPAGTVGGRIARTSKPAI
jgi:hypothetical protein